MSCGEPLVTAFIGLGSNLGDRRATLESAIEGLRRIGGVSVKRVSDVIETEPVGIPSQPRFLNAVAAVETEISARQLLSACLQIEAQHGRDRTAQDPGGPRQLDLDLLLYGSRIIDEPGLRVPHPRMLERAFVLVPLAQIAPTAMHPQSGRTIQSHLTELGSPRFPEYDLRHACSSP